MSKTYKAKVGDVCYFPSRKEQRFTVCDVFKSDKLKFVEIIGFVGDHLTEKVRVRQEALIYITE